MNTSQQCLKNNKAALKNNAGTMQYHTSRFIQSQSSELAQAINFLKKSKEHLIKTEMRNLQEQQEDLVTNYENIYQKTQQNINFTEKKLMILHPSNVLKRGYSITRASGKVLGDIKELEDGQIIETELYKGIVESRVEKTKTKKTK
jgi:exodeoxyribonuclease VII large subunit